MPLPLPNKPPGCIQVTAQLNAPGYEPTTITVHPRIVAKLAQLVTTEMDYTVQPPRLRYASLTDAMVSILKTYLLEAAEARFPDPPTSEEIAAEANLQAIRDAARPKFL